MSIRPVDIARKLNISTTTLRTYESLGLIPPVVRTESGYRVFTDEHIAYFIAIREMMAGFGMTCLSKLLKHVVAKDFDAAFWVATKAQAELHQEKVISDKIRLNLLRDNKISLISKHKRLTINDISRETGVPATTIRYWHRVGLISVARDRENNYRLFSAQHIREILTIYALKFSVYTDSHRYSVEKVKAELEEFDPNDRERIETIADDIKQHLDHRNRDQIKAIAALHRLCVQVEADHFEKQL